nr:hypothetical protein [uncultured Celeribacter sp.]
MKVVGPQEYLEFVESVSDHLDAKLYSDARDIEYGQWEIPFEAVLLALLKEDFALVEFDHALVFNLAKEAKILDEGVLDPDTWKKFRDWSGLNIAKSTHPNA